MNASIFRFLSTLLLIGALVFCGVSHMALMQGAPTHSHGSAMSAHASFVPQTHCFAMTNVPLTCTSSGLMTIVFLVSFGLVIILSSLLYRSVRYRVIESCSISPPLAHWLALKSHSPPVVLA